MPLDRAVDAHLARDGEVNPHVPEERSSRSREIVPIRGEALEGGFAGLQERQAVLTAVLVLDHVRRQFPVDRATELIHGVGLPSQLLQPCWGMPPTPDRVFPPSGS